MRVWNLERGKGKTIRMLYASEYTGNNIITSDLESANILEDKAKELGLNIPKVLSVSDFMYKGLPCSEEIIIDEALFVLEALIKSIRPRTKVSDITLTC